MARRVRREHIFAETDGQVYLVRERGVWRFPRAGVPLPFPVDPGRTMDFGADVVHRVKPRLSYHPEEWFLRDDLFSRRDVDDLVKKAVYMTMGRLVAEILVARDGRVLMEHAVRGFSRGYWNLPGGFIDFGEAPEDAAAREALEELGVPVRIDGLLATYVSGFPGKPTFTYGFVYLASLLREDFHLKADEVGAADWFPAWRALELTRNPFARWAIVDAHRRGIFPAMDVRRHAPRRGRGEGGPVIFLDRDDVINRGREGYVLRPDQFEFLPGVKGATKALTSMGYRLAVVTNQDPVGWKLLSEGQLRRIHAKMLRGLEAGGARVENVYYCSHHLFDDCPCRKPRAGLLMEALRDLDAPAKDAWMVGDKVGDILAGKAIGAHTAFIGDAKRRARFAEELQAARPDLAVPSLAAFARALRKGYAPPPRPAYT